MLPTPQPLDTAQMHAVIRLLELRESGLPLATHEIDRLARARTLSSQQAQAVRMLLPLDDAAIDRALSKACADGEATELLLEHRAYEAHMRKFPA